MVLEIERAETGPGELRFVPRAIGLLRTEQIIDATTSGLRIRFSRGDQAEQRPCRL